MGRGRHCFPSELTPEHILSPSLRSLRSLKSFDSGGPETHIIPHGSSPSVTPRVYTDFDTAYSRPNRQPLAYCRFSPGACKVSSRVLRMTPLELTAQADVIVEQPRPHSTAIWAVYHCQCGLGSDVAETQAQATNTHHAC